MARALSVDLRSRIAAALSEGATTRSVAKRFGVSVATAVRLGQKQRTGDSLHPRKRGGRRPAAVTGDHLDWLRKRLAEKGDLTIRALVVELADRGVKASHDTVWRTVRRLGLSFKKNAGGQGAGWAEAGSVPGAMEGPSAQD